MLIVGPHAFGNNLCLSIDSDIEPVNIFQPRPVVSRRRLHTFLESLQQVSVANRFLNCLKLVSIGDFLDVAIAAREFPVIGLKDAARYGRSHLGEKVLR